jgi:hypothetical protein
MVAELPQLSRPSQGKQMTPWHSCSQSWPIFKFKPPGATYNLAQKNLEEIAELVLKDSKSGTHEYSFRDVVARLVLNSHTRLTVCQEKPWSDLVRSPKSRSSSNEFTCTAGTADNEALSINAS